jgi:hypothetical protein
MVIRPIESRARKRSKSDFERPRQAHASRWIHFGIESNALRMSQKVSDPLGSLLPTPV